MTFTKLHQLGEQKPADVCVMQVVACELLHSLVIYTVGKNAQIVEGENSLPPMYKLHQRLFPVLMRLACDVDQVCAPLMSIKLRPGIRQEPASMFPGSVSMSSSDANVSCVMHPQVTRQLFEPLVMQLIHWFTNNKKFESQDTVAVLEAIMVGSAFVVLWSSRELPCPSAPVSGGPGGPGRQHAQRLFWPLHPGVCEMVH